MSRVADMFDRLLSAGIDHDSIDATELRRVRFFNSYVLIGIFGCAGSAVVLRFSAPANTSYLALLATLGILIGLGISLHYLKRAELPVQIMLVFLFGLAFFILTQSKTSTGIFWLYVYAPIAALLLRQKLALAWIVSFATWVLFLGLQPWFGDSMHGAAQIYAFTFSFLPISFFMVAYQKITYDAERQVYEQQRQLQALTERLEEELAFASASKKQLDGLSKSLTQQNKKLTQSRMALINLLEDSKVLEKELKKSKQHIEETVQKRTRELSIERARLESTLQSLPIAVLLMNAKGQVEDANSMAYELVGKTYQAAEGKLSLAVSRRLALLVRKHLALSNQIKQCVKQDNCILVPEVQHHDAYYRVALGPVRTNDPNAQGGVVVVIENITAQKMLDRSKDEFLMIASHELRTPLTAIRGNAVILDKLYGKRVKDTDFKELTEDIKESSTRLIGIVNDYLELSSLEQGRLVLQPDKLDLTELMQQVVRENQSLALEKNLKLSFVQPRTPHLFVRADPNRTRQVIENLISNAVHYTNKGTVKIELVKTGQYITCRVRDTGIGIAKTSQKQLFGKFRQAQENLLTRDPMRSTGLGLYITKLMVEKMGGKIVLEHSALGKGSVFAFTLPVAERSAGSSRASKPLQLR